MPLEKQPFKLPLAQGMDQGKNPRTLTGGLSLIQNGVFRKVNEVLKRPGWTSLPKLTSTGDTISSADAVAVYSDELLLWSKNRIHTYSPGQDRWSDRGAAYSCAVETKQITSKSTQSMDYADSVYSDGLVLVAWETGLRTYYQLYDYESGAVLATDSGLFPTSLRPKCLAFSDGSLWIAYAVVGGGIYAQQIDRTSGVASPVVFPTLTGPNFINCWDMIMVAPDTAMLCYGDSSGNFVINYFNSAMSARGGSYVDSSTTPGNPSILRLIKQSSGSVVLAYVSTTQTNIQGRTINATGSSIGAAKDLGVAKSSGSLAAAALSGHDLPSQTSGVHVRIYVQFTHASNEQNNIVIAINWNLTSNTAVTAGPGYFMRSVGLASRGFVHNSIGFVTLFHRSDLQATFFVADENGVIVSRHQPGTAGGGAFNAAVANVWSAVSGRYEFAILNKTRIIATTDTLQLYTAAGSAAPNGSRLYSLVNVAHTYIDFQDNSNFSAVEAGDTLLIAGGALKMYDGLSVVEHGFFLYPEGLSATSTTGSIADGTYLYVAIYEWTDAKGNIHRSAPSVPLSVSITGGPKGNIITIPTLRITAKDATIALYRTQANQTASLYRVSSIASPPNNNPGVDSITITDQLADASLPGRDILYTAGGILDNTAALAARYIKVWRGRVMLGGNEDGVIQYSKPVSKGAPVEFAAENTLALESDGGSITGFEILDEKLIVFKKSWPYLTYGDGPDASGLNGSFAQLERISSCDVGCIDQQSTCGIPGAVIFKSEKGWQMLGRDLSAAYIGGPIEDYNALSVTSATLFATQSEIRLTHSDGVCLVYNYEFQSWSVFTNHNAVDAVRWKGSFVHAKADGSVCVETEGSYRDDGVNYPLSILTGWQSLGDIAGFQRIYRAQITGDYYSPCTLTLKAAYDNAGSWQDTGSISVLAGDKGSWQFYPKQQKCEAIRFEITASVSETLLSGKGVSFVLMSLLFGIKRPLSKVSSGSKAGLSTI